MRSDWLVKLQISFAIYLRQSREKIASQFASVTGEEIIHRFNYTKKKTIHLSPGG